MPPPPPTRRLTPPPRIARTGNRSCAKDPRVQLSRSPERLRRSDVQTVWPADSTHTATISQPNGLRPSFGARPKKQTTRTTNKMPNVAAARPGRYGYFRMVWMLIESDTKSRPSRAADAPTAAMKKSCHAAAVYAVIEKSWHESFRGV